MSFLLKLPLVLLSTSGFFVAMLIPSIYGFVSGDSLSGRTYLYGALLGCGLCFVIGLATADQKPAEDRRALLLTLMFIFAVMPVALAIPNVEILRTTTLFHAYLDMISAITTTALPVYDADRLPEAMILWRSVVAWVGGLYVWVAAIVIFLPLRLGGFETLSTDHRYTGPNDARRAKDNTLTHRFIRELQAILPIYLSLTMAVFILLTLTGQDEFSAAIYAMGTVSTAGYMPDDHRAVDLGFAEVIIFVVLLFSLTRRTYGPRFSLMPNTNLRDDRELRLGLTLVAAVTVVLFFRHFFGAAIVENTEDPARMGAALWGSLFTSLSFLTTTGYVSEGWNAAQFWSGLNNPGVILVGLAIVGGGAATAAGGIKLLRISNLLRHSQLEIKQLVSPNRVLSRKATGFGGQVQNAIWAWVFFMFFFLALGLIFVALAFSGTSFEQGLVLSIATLTNTGPLVNVVEGVDINVLSLSDLGKGTLVAAMVLGRVETLAILALLNPDIWRK